MIQFIDLLTCVARLSETQEELVELKISAETERQRKAKGLLTDSTEGTYFTYM